MAFKTRKSPKLEQARLRLSGLKAIDAKLDLGGGASVADGTTLLTTADKALADYNELLSKAADALNTVVDQEKLAAAWSKKALSGVSFKYGDDSSEYEQAGGIRRSERKKAVRKPKAA